jgi:hypothetical protein
MENIMDQQTVDTVEKIFLGDETEIETLIQLKCARCGKIEDSVAKGTSVF